MSGTLVNTYTQPAPVPNEPVTLTLNGTQSCTAHDQRQRRGLVHHHAERAGRDLHADAARSAATRRRRPVLLSTTGSSTFTENKAPTTVTYTGSTSITSGHSADALGHADRPTARRCPARP